MRKYQPPPSIGEIIYCHYCNGDRPIDKDGCCVMCGVILGRKNESNK